MDLGTATVKFAGDTTGLVSAITGAKGSIGGFASSALAGLGPVGVAFGIASASAVGLGAKVTKMAADFQTQTNMFVTSAGESSQSLDMVRAGVLQLAVDTATSTSQLNAGMYMVESAGYHGAAGLLVLKAAAMGAKAENADLSTVTNAVTSALNAYHLGADQAVPVTNDLVAAVGAGKMKMQDLSAALKNVLPAAAAAHISLSDVTAAIATMTAQGDPADSAATHLRQVILALEAPAKAGAKALTEIGLTTQQVTDDMRKSLPDTLALIEDHLKNKFPEGSAAYNEALKNIAGGNKQLLGMLELTGSHMQVFKDDVVQITNQVEKGGNAVYGWDLIQSSFNFKLQKAAEVAETLGIKVGTVLLPLLGPLIDNVTSLVQGFGDWATSTDGLVGKINQFTAFVTYLYQTLQSNGALTEFGSIMSDIGQTVGNVTNVALSVLGTIFGTTASQAGKASDAATNVANGFKQVLDTIKPLTDAASWLSSQFADAGVKGQILRDVLITIGGAIAGIKIAEFAPGFIKAMTDAGLSAKGFGLQLVGLQTQADETAISVASVGKASAGSASKQWFADLEQSLNGVGTAAKGASSAETAAATSAGSLKTSFSDLGLAMGPIIGIATGVRLALGALPSTMPGIHDMGAQIDKTTMSFGGWVHIVQDGNQVIQQQTQQMALIASRNFDTMYKNATNSTTQLRTGVTVDLNQMKDLSTESTQSMSDYVQQRLAEMGTKGSASIANATAQIETSWFNMHQQVYSNTTFLTDKATSLIGQLHDSVIGDFASMDAQAIGYWNDVANYIEGNPIVGSVSYTTQNIGGSGAASHHFASGTTYAPGGPSEVGEGGSPELVVGPHMMNLARGSGVFPLSQLGSGGEIHNHISIYLDSTEMTNQVMTRAVNEIRQRGRQRR